MKIQPSTLLLSLALLAGNVPSQKLALAVNDNLPPAAVTGASAWFCIQVQAPATGPLALFGAQFLFKAGQATQDFAIYDQDPGTGKPLNQLALGSFNAVPYPVWQGGLLAQPLILMPNQVFFLAFDNSRGGNTLPIVQGGTRQIHYWSTNWNGPFTSQNWAFRLYTPGGAGTLTAFGTGSTGSAGQALLTGLGWPNTRNPLGFLASSVSPNSAGLLILGRWIPGLRLGGLGTLYTFPILATLPAVADASAPFAHMELWIPNDPFLAGARLAAQYWFLDPTGPGGLVHTGGLDMTLGN